MIGPGFRSASSGPREVGIAGLGLIGAAVTRRLVAAGRPVVGYDIDAGKAAPLEALGLRPVGSLGQLAATANRILIAVFDTQQVESAIEGPDGLLAAGNPDQMIFVCLSTCDPKRIKALGERVAARGATLLECALSGTSDQVAKGEGVGLVAGDRARVNDVADILAAICRRHYVLGALGNGNSTKLAINLILGLNRAALAEGLVFAERLGLSPDAFLDVARGSAAYSQIMDVKGEKMIAGDFAPHGKISQSLKDFSLIVKAAHAAGQELPLATVYRALMQGCVDHGEAELDNAAIIAEIRRRGPAPPPEAP